MTLTAAQYAKIAQSYYRAAADPFVPYDKRKDYARAAEWFHYLSTRGKGRAAGAAPDELSSDRLRRSYGALLTLLWLIGAAVCLVGTLLFTNAVGLFEDRDRPNQVAEITLPVKRPPQPTIIYEQAKAASDLQAVTPERRHAISPDQPAYEAN
jgi:hypothetical protein